jgi:hypothetical protein
VNKRIFEAKPRRDKHAENSHPTNHFQYLHDHSLVRAPQVQKSFAHTDYRCQLGNRFFRIYFSGSSEQDRFELFQFDATQDHAGMYHLSRVYGVRAADFSGTIAMEQFGVVHAANRSSRIRLLAALTEPALSTPLRWLYS